MSAFIDEHRERFGVEPICRSLGVSASAYYQRATGERSARRIEDERLLVEIRRVHKANYECYGYRRTWKQLLREGEQVPRCRVQRLMASHGIEGAKRRGKPWRTTRPDPDAQRRPDLVNRQFAAEAPNLCWVADFTYVRCWEGMTYFAFVLDVFSRMIVGWQFASHMRDELVLDALAMAVGQRQPTTRGMLIHHSDSGSQYTSGDFTLALQAYGLLGSTGSVGDAYDNAMAESFVDSFKTELIADRVWRTRAQLELAIVEWVGWLNHRRLHEALGDIPPVEFEQRYATRLGLIAPIPGNGSVTSLSPRAADGRRTRRIAPAEFLEARNDAKRRSLSATTATSTAPNGHVPTASTVPPVEMRSRGQPANGSDRAERLHGLPTGLGQPANGSRRDGRLHGLPTFPQALPLSSIGLNDITTKEPN